MILGTKFKFLTLHKKTQQFKIHELKKSRQLKNVNSEKLKLQGWPDYRRIKTERRRFLVLRIGNSKKLDIRTAKFK